MSASASEAEIAARIGEPASERLFAPVGSCLICGQTPAIHLRFCNVCQGDVGFPNVRAAARPTERLELSRRYCAAESQALAQDCQVEFRRLHEMGARSKAVFNRYLGSLQNWLLSDNPLFLNFYGQVKGGREPKDERWENQRATVENAINPHYFDQLSVAALSTDSRGLDYYGPYTVTLREDIISHRSTCFEENPFYFCKRAVYTPGEDIPPGYRSIWEERGLLTAAKLGNRLTSGMSDDDIGALMLERRGLHADCDFIEVHIFGPIHSKAIERVSGPLPSGDADRAIWSHLKRVLADAGAEVLERT